MGVRALWFSADSGIDFDHSQYDNIVFLLLTLNKYLLVGFERQIIMFWKHRKKAIYFLRISWKAYFIQRFIIAPNWNHYEHLTMLWTYYDVMYICSICWGSKFAQGIPSVFSSFHPVIWSAISSLFPGDFIFFAKKPTTYLNHWNSETSWEVFNSLRSESGLWLRLKYLQIIMGHCTVKPA